MQSGTFDLADFLHQMPILTQLSQGFVYPPVLKPGIFFFYMLGILSGNFILQVNPALVWQFLTINGTTQYLQKQFKDWGTFQSFILLKFLKNLSQIGIFFSEIRIHVTCVLLKEAVPGFHETISFKSPCISHKWLPIWATKVWHLLLANLPKCQV